MRQATALLAVMLATGFLLPVFVSTVAAAQDPGTPQSGPLPSGLIERLVIDRVKWPVRFKPTTPDGCAALAPELIGVREDGDRRQAVEIGEEPLPTTHLLLIDTSGSMTGGFEQARKAAREYIRAVPRDHRVMLLSFDEEMRLWGAATGDRASVLEGVARMQPLANVFTTLWDALYNLMLYLEGSRDRKVLVVVTDGCDSLSLPHHRYDQVVELANQAKQLTILPIMIGERTVCPYDLSGVINLAPKTYMETLARRTGGELAQIRSTRGLVVTFREIIKQLSQEGYVIYEALPFGAGPKDEPRKKDSRFRKVSIGAEAKGCKVTSAGPPSRLVSRRDPLVPEVDEGGFALRPQRLAGRLRDVKVARGRLYLSERIDTSRRFTLQRDRQPLFANRIVEVPFPAFERLQERGESPVPLLVDLLRRCLDDLQSCADDSAGLPSFMADGQAFFSIRGALGKGLLAAPGYGEWATAKIQADRRAWLQDAIAASPEARNLSPAGRVRLTRAVIERPLQSVEIQEYLSEWLGDVRAVDLATDLEAAAIEKGDAELRGVVRRSWPLLAHWFAPPTALRTKTLLLPAFSKARRTVGFYRVHLPWPEQARLPDDTVPTMPEALGVLEWAGAGDGIAVFRDGTPRVESLVYAPLDRAGERRYHEWLTAEGYQEFVDSGRIPWSVTLSLAFPRVGEVVLKKYFHLVPLPALSWPPEAEEAPVGPSPFCLRLLPESSLPEAQQASLIRDLHRRGRYCP